MDLNRLHVLHPYELLSSPFNTCYTTCFYQLSHRHDTFYPLVTKVLSHHSNALCALLSEAVRLRGPTCKSHVYLSSSFLGQELNLDGHLLCRNRHSRPCHSRGDPRHLVQDPPRLHNRNPVRERTLSGTHTCLRRPHRDRLVREHPDPDLSATTSVPSHCPTPGLDLTGRDPGRFLRLQSEGPESDRVSARCLALHAPPVLLSVLYSPGAEHAPGRSLRWRGKRPSVLLFAIHGPEYSSGILADRSCQLVQVYVSTSCEKRR
jgi:hypothetical protein